MSTCGVFNIDRRATEDMLIEIFQQAGPIEDYRLPLDSDGQPRGFAFIDYEFPDTADYAVALFEGTTFLFGRMLRVENAYPVTKDEGASSSRDLDGASQNDGTGGERLWKERHTVESRIYHDQYRNSPQHGSHNNSPSHHHWESNNERANESPPHHSPGGYGRLHGTPPHGHDNISNSNQNHNRHHHHQQHHPHHPRLNSPPIPNRGAIPIPLPHGGRHSPLVSVHELASPHHQEQYNHGHSQPSNQHDYAHTQPFNTFEHYSPHQYRPRVHDDGRYHQTGNYGYNNSNSNKNTSPMHPLPLPPPPPYPAAPGRYRR